MARVYVCVGGGGERTLPATRDFLSTSRSDIYTVRARDATRRYRARAEWTDCCGDV